ncbi:enoyl-CoA hydratase [Phenylobacterium zucineum HLK1]|uniref:Enoyl-CoA hydratase n=1 Tax=Phenylobacterium zucineum (strain HLK1) TaxID=450851 RepID=B4RH05_PHEZH|nr:enoyl-CoA hydratase-related protein [Phenylobacterium zucineum]ACG78953.1 enoyl-CoA hydratase [Phenylobacterium zucineum HLK1]
MSRSVLEAVQDGVMTITLNRPERLNAMNGELMEQLLEAVQRAAADPKVACVVLTGAGRGFCSGGDLKNKDAEIAADALLPPEQRKRPQTIEAKIARLRRLTEAARLLHDMPKPTVAMINGACAGAGLSLAGACDLRIAAQSAVITSAFGKAGLSGDFGGSWFWSRILGAAKVRELYLLSERRTAAEALAFGLVHRVVPDEELLTHVQALTLSIATGPTHAYGFMKRNLAAAEDGALEEVLDLEATTMTLCSYEIEERRLLEAAQAATRGPPS